MIIIRCSISRALDGVTAHPDEAWTTRPSYTSDVEEVMAAF